MKRLGRIATSSLAWLSLFVCFITVALWIRGNFRMDRVWVMVRPDHRPDLSYGLMTLQSGNSGLGFSYNLIDFTHHPDPGRNAKAVYDRTHYVASQPQYPNEWHGIERGAFHWKRWPASPAELPCFVGAFTCTVPNWFVVAVTLPGSAFVVRRLSTRRRTARAGLCRVCGYDLRATPNRCPECGAPVP